MNIALYFSDLNIWRQTDKSDRQYFFVSAGIIYKEFPFWRSNNQRRILLEHDNLFTGQDLLDSVRIEQGLVTIAR